MCFIDFRETIRPCIIVKYAIQTHFKYYELNRWYLLLVFHFCRNFGTFLFRLSFFVFHFCLLFLPHVHFNSIFYYIISLFARLTNKYVDSERYHILYVCVSNFCEYGSMQFISNFFFLVCAFPLSFLFFEISKE